MAQRYCILKKNLVIDLTTGTPITTPLDQMHLTGNKLFYFERPMCQWLIRINKEINDHNELDRPMLIKKISQLNLILLQVSTDYQSLDEAKAGILFNEDNYQPLVKWIDHQIALKQKYLNLLFLRTAYWEQVLKDGGDRLEADSPANWSDEMLTTSSYGLIDQLYNHPADVETLGQGAFKYLDHIPFYLRDYLNKVLVEENFDEPELKKEYQLFSRMLLRTDQLTEFKKFHFFGMEIKLTYGGLHYNADDYYERPIKLIDFKAYYPNLMITFGLQSRRIVVPEQLGYLKQWLKIRNDLSNKNPEIQTKIPADFKEIKDKFKIFQSSLYGCLRDTASQRKSNLYDPLTGIVLTFTGQWIMLAFIKQLKPFIKRVYGINTDGLFLEWRNEAEDEQRIKTVVNKFYELTHIRYTYEQFDRCFFFKFNQLLCYRQPTFDQNGATLKATELYAKGDYFKNYNKFYDDDYYITQSLVDFYLNHQPIAIRNYPLSYFKKTLSLKRNAYGKKRFFIYDSEPSIITIDELQERAPELFTRMRAQSTKFHFNKVEYRRLNVEMTEAYRQKNMLTIYPAKVSPKSYMVRTYDKDKADTYDNKNFYAYYDEFNQVKFIFECDEFVENPEDIGWKCRVKYLNAKITNGADAYTIGEPDPNLIDYNFCEQRIDEVIAKLPANSFYKLYPTLKKETF